MVASRGDGRRDWNLFIETCLRLSLSIFESDMKLYAPIIWYTLFRDILKAIKEDKHDEAYDEIVSYLKRAQEEAGDVAYNPSFILDQADESRYKQRLAFYLRKH